MNLFDRVNYNYDFPPELIAHQPLATRDASRMMLLNRASSNIAHANFADLTQYLPKDAVLVFNESKVLPARLYTQKSTGGKVEILLTRELKPGIWEALGQPIKSLKVGMRLTLLTRKTNSPSNTQVEVVHLDGGRNLWVQLPPHEDLLSLLAPFGHIPLPHYINRDAPKASDEMRYQTVFANKLGSAAAPTAGLHFTDAMMEQLVNQGFEIHKVCLHVGPGTFLPIKSNDIRDHEMHSEYFQMDESVYQNLLNAKQQGRPIICVGTTALRVVETVFSKHELSGLTNLYIYPGYSFKMASGLLTNFHQPESTLMVLVATLAGYELIKQAYQQAIEEKYRLFSYGDCMLIV